MTQVLWVCVCVCVCVCVAVCICLCWEGCSRFAHFKASARRTLDVLPRDYVIFLLNPGKVVFSWRTHKDRAVAKTSWKQTGKAQTHNPWRQAVPIWRPASHPINRSPWLIVDSVMQTIKMLSKCKFSGISGVYCAVFRFFLFPPLIILHTDFHTCNSVYVCCGERSACESSCEMWRLLRPFKEKKKKPPPWWLHDDVIWVTLI